MRPLLYTMALLAIIQLSLKSGTSAPHVKPDCPTITVECVDCQKAGWLITPLTFTASVNGNEAASTLTYNWTLSVGEITDGQGTPTIKVDTTRLALKSVTATVEIVGLQKECARTASATTEVVGCIFPRKFDEYGDISFEDEKARLDNLAVQLKNEPEAVGYILIYAGRRARINEAQRRLDRVKNYLVDVRGIAGSRIVTIDGGYREELTVELWAVPADSPPITADKTSTIDASEVEIIPDPPQRERTRKRNR